MDGLDIEISEKIEARQNYEAIVAVLPAEIEEAIANAPARPQDEETKPEETPKKAEETPIQPPSIFHPDGELIEDIPFNIPA